MAMLRRPFSLAGRRDVPGAVELDIIHRVVGVGTSWLAQLKRAVPTVPIATGEDHYGRHVFRDLVERRCVDILMPDLKFCGGLTEALKIYAIGEAAGIATIPHSGADAPFGQSAY